MARRLLAILAAAPGRVIRTDQILDQLWPETRPATANKTLQTHIVHLRRALGPKAIAHRSGGYLLDTAVVALDANDLEALAQQAEKAVANGRIDEASTALESAVRLLRGMPFDEFAVDEFALAEVVRLQELAWRAIELSAECAIEKGTAPAAISYLECLVAEQPLRESAWTVLIQAQVAAGRRGDATRTAERARAVLAQELGSRPGPALRAAAAKIPVAEPDLVTVEPLSPSLAAFGVAALRGRAHGWRRATVCRRRGHRALRSRRQ